MRENDAESQYPNVIQSIGGRLLACNESLIVLEKKRESPDNWKHLDFVALQMRKVCELFMLASTLAHLNEGQVKLNAKQWQPQNAFLKLNEVNDYPMPIPIRPQLNVRLDQTTPISPISKPLPIELLSAIHGQCSAFLHAPSAAKVLSETITPFDVRKFRGWVDGYTALLSAHLLMLPDSKKLLVCLWNSPSSEPQVSLLEGNTKVHINFKFLPDFSMLVK